MAVSTEPSHDGTLIRRSSRIIIAEYGQADWPMIKYRPNLRRGFSFWGTLCSLLQHAPRSMYDSQERWNPVI